MVFSPLARSSQPHGLDILHYFVGGLSFGLWAKHHEGQGKTIESNVEVTEWLPRLTRVLYGAKVIALFTDWPL